MNAPWQDPDLITLEDSDRSTLLGPNPVISETSSVRCFHRQKPPDPRVCSTDHHYHFPLTVSVGGYVPRSPRQYHLASPAPVSWSPPPQSPSPFEFRDAGEYVVVEECVGASPRSPHCEIDSSIRAAASASGVAQSLLRTQPMRGRRD